MSVFHFPKLEKRWVFFLKADLIPKLHLKSNALLSTVVRIMITIVIVAKVKVTYNVQMIMETIIIEVAFFSVSVLFLFNSFLLILPASQTLRHWWGSYQR